MERTAFTIYLLVLILSPLLFGSVHTYAYTIMAGGILVGSLLLAINNINKDAKSGRYNFRLPNTGAEFLFYSLFLLLVFQLIPLPETWLNKSSPEAWKAGQNALAPSSITSMNKQIIAWSTTSTHLYPVRMSLIRWTVYGLFFFGLVQTLNARKRIEIIIALILITGCFEAIYGIAEKYSETPYIWWFKKMGGLIDVTGTYINHNHFAGFMEMGVLLSAGYAAGLASRRRKKKSDPNNKLSLRQKLAFLMAKEQRLTKRTLILFAGVIMGVGLILSASRGGLISIAAALLLMSLLYVFRKGFRRKGLTILCLFVATSSYAIHMGTEYTTSRFKTLFGSIAVRSRFTQEAIRVFEDYRLVGAGIGNFRYVYPKYQNIEDKNLYIRYAHNDWVQFLVEAGITGIFLLVVGSTYYLIRLVRQWVKRKDPLAVCLGSVLFSVMAVMAIHSVFDFNLHIPANFLIFTAILAIGNSAIYIKRHRGPDSVLGIHHTLPLRYRGALMLMLMIGIISWSGYLSIRHFMAEAHCNTVYNSTLNRDRNPSLEEIEKAIQWDPFNGAYYYKKALELARLRNAEFGKQFNAKRNQRQMEIIQALEEAASANPFNSRFHLRLGWEYTFLWQKPDYHRVWLPAADIAMERADYYAGIKTPSLHVEMGNYWTMRSKSFTQDNPARMYAWANACRHYIIAQKVDGTRRMLKSIIQYVENFHPQKEMVLQAIYNPCIDLALEILGQETG